MLGSLWRGREPLNAAVARQLVTFERLVLRIWQILTIAGVVTGLLYAVLVSRSLGLSCAVAAAFYFGWFMLIGYLHDRAQVTRALIVASMVVEGLIPWIFLAMIVIAKGADYALASWVPPFLFCSCLMAYVPRLDPRKPVVFGLICGIVYPLLYVVLIRDRLPSTDEISLIHQPATQVTRGVTLFASGLVTALLVAGFRQVIVGAADVASEPSSSTDVLGRYRRIRQLAEGVFEAIAGGGRGVERRVVVEYLPATASELATGAERAIGVLHPNIAQVIDVGREPDATVVVSERIDGVSLAGVLRSMLATAAPAPPQVVAHVGVALLSALDHLHRGALGADGQPLRLVYGFDPELVVVTRRGEIKLTDVWRSAQHSASSWPTAIAPELSRGAAPSEQSDLYAVGVVLWELLAGELRRPEHAAVPLTSRHPRLERRWDAFFLGVLAPDPGLRPASARQMSFELESLMPASVPGAREWLARTVSTARSAR